MYSAIAANKRNTVIIMIFFVILIGGLGWLISELYGGGYFITAGVVIGALFYTLLQYFIADKVALSINGAHQIEKRDNPRLYRIVENLSITTGMPMPKVYVIEDPAPNAFATGRDPNHASVAATTGLLNIMDDTELEAVMAHELGHVQNYDIRVTMIVFGLVSIVGLIADIMLRLMWFGGNDRRDVPPAMYLLGIVAAILTPLIAMLVQLAVSRQREYLADATGAMTTRHPEGLANALTKIGHYGSSMKRQNSSTAHLFFANPLKGATISKLFSTHPPVKDRVARLRKMSTKL